MPASGAVPGRRSQAPLTLARLVSRVLASRPRNVGDGHREDPETAPLIAYHSCLPDDQVRNHALAADWQR